MQKVLATCRNTQTAWKTPQKRAALKAKKAAEKKAAEEGEKDGEKDDKEEKKEPEEKPQDDDSMDIDDLDVMGVEDVCDIGGCQPLFANFQNEDWVLLGLRCELHLLVHAFKRDTGDPERTGIHKDHLGFYYNKYFKKQFNLRSYACDTLEKLVKLVKDTLAIESKTQTVGALLSDDLESFDMFMKLAEEHRRERVRRADAGDETAVLKFAPAAAFGGAPAQQQGGGYKPGFQKPGYQKPGFQKPGLVQGAQRAPFQPAYRRVWS